jgi:hypothetical protein
MRNIHFLFGLLLCSCQILLSQEKFEVSHTQFYKLPSKEMPSEIDLSANAKVIFTADSFYFDIFVKDDNITNQDRIDIWFGSPWTDFSDYIVGEKNKKTFIFRNSAESGDEANLQRFIQDADYPKGKLKNAESGIEIKPIVPQANNLKREYIFNGITRFEFSSNQITPKQLDLDKYKPLENQLGMKLDDLSSFAKYRVSKTDSGLYYRIAMNNKCLGFARAVKMNEMRYVIDIIDGDPGETTEQIISSTANRFYGRPYYFNKIALPFVLNIVPEGVPASMIQKMGINQDVIFSGGSWKAYGLNVGGIVYGKDFISEALTELFFYPIQLIYSKSTTSNNVAVERLDLKYKDATCFLQHEVYTLINDKIFSGKEYRYTNRVESNFINSVFTLADGTNALVIYDYEPVDPLGFGEYGHTADEFISIMKTDNQNLLNIGHRIEAASNIVIGEKNPQKIENVKSVNYAWVDFGKLFEIDIKGIQSKDNKTLRFRINEKGEVVSAD